MRFAGIDPGTSSYEIFILEDSEPHDRIEIETSAVREDPESVKKIFADLEVDVYAGLSGYGLPFKRFSELDEKDIFLMTLNKDEEKAIGMRSLIDVAIKLDLEIYTIPAVIHLPTVPEYRKINKIDMGTADKLCSVVLALYSCEDVGTADFILVESGYGFNAFISVSRGKIIDGLGGSSSFPAFSSLGAMDGELAYLLGDFPKRLLFSGGIKSYLHDMGIQVNSISEMPEDSLVWLAEYLLKGVRAVNVQNTDRILMSGRNFLNSRFRKIFVEMAEDFTCERLEGFGISKQSAEGAAIIANGIAGGEYKHLVTHLELDKASGSVLDYITSDIRRHLNLQKYF
ncbi:putative butyrate kinase [Archaeoglobus sulfaticallidus PM70-1]|uniref:Putative butyrate kinase n=1 Tax=Archaeoglobus sulfaticallidus PM70-1 TaxID=387631 RepID=N0BLN8_9EURY|nr:DUF1464 family protein [Archaeoglobus sulfaticallidus]AGK61140.1 putative butyrate kinase [Archaeoglobus sulfaticallidus PM70-1]